MRAIKISVDRDRRPGRFLLTGSANVLTIPRVAESLAGRMELHTLWPLSQGELERRRETFIDRIFDAKTLQYKKNLLLFVPFVSLWFSPKEEFL